MGLWIQILARMRIAVYCHSIAPSIDGVCRRFSGILAEFVRMKHEVVLFTLEEEPEDLPDGLIDVISLDWMVAPAYPGEKIALTHLKSLMRLTLILIGPVRRRISF